MAATIIKPRPPTRADKIRAMEPRTWGELKVALAAEGLKDADIVYGLDIGPYRGKIVILREDLGVEIWDDAGEVMG